MAYAQKNYSQTQGISGRYSISSIGCFITAFCNLEADFGNNIAPDTLDNFFRDNDVYIDIDDGIRDDLDWPLISRYDSATTVGHTADHGTDRTAGWPSTNQSIVRFYYRSISAPTLANGQPNMIFHFCKVADASAHLIVDSWDGEIKKSPYGEPTGWAEYNHGAPTPAPITTPVQTYQVTETYSGGKQVQLNKQPTNLWGMNYANPGSLPPVEVHNQGEIWTVTNKVHHQNGYDYYRRDGQIDGFNVLDCDDYTPPPPRPPDAPLPIPTSTEPYTVVKTILGYATSNDAANDINAKTTVSPGPNYYVFNRRYSSTNPDQLIALNITTTPGKPGNWINPDKNVEDVPVAPPVNPMVAEKERMIANRAPTPAPAEETTPVTVTVKPPSPDDWKKMTPLNEDRVPELYISMNKTEIHIRDMEQHLSPLPLEPLSPLHIIGTFKKDGVTYGRTSKIAREGLWYGIPMGILESAEYKGVKITDYWTLIKHKLSKLIQDVRF